MLYNVNTYAMNMELSYGKGILTAPISHLSEQPDPCSSDLHNSSRLLKILNYGNVGILGKIAFLSYS